MRITKNGTILNVTKGAYQALFASDNWVEVAGDFEPIKHPHQASVKAMNPQPVGEVGTKGSANKEVSDIPFQQIFQQSQEVSEVTKPLSEMTISELIEFADDHGIDISEVKGKQNIKKAISEALKA